MGRRFSRINYAVRRLGMTGGAGAALAEFRAGDRPYNVEGVPRGADASVALEPFGYDPADTVEALIFYSGRASQQLATFNLTAAILGHVAAPTNPQSIAKLQPARAVCSERGAAATTPQTSQITGLSYKKRETTTYTFPFGRVGAKGEFTVQSDIVEAVEGTPTHGVTFKPERLYRG